MCSPLCAATIHVKEVREFAIGSCQVANESRHATIFRHVSKDRNHNQHQRKVNAMLNVIRQFVKEEEGLAAAEYAMLLTLDRCWRWLRAGLGTFRGSHCRLRVRQRHHRRLSLIDRSREGIRLARCNIGPADLLRCKCKADGGVLRRLGDAVDRRKGMTDNGFDARRHTYDGSRDGGCHGPPLISNPQLAHLSRDGLCTCRTCLAERISTESCLAWPALEWA